MKRPQRLYILSNFHTIAPICHVTTALKRREIAGAEGREWQKNLSPCHSFSQVNVKCSHFTKQCYAHVKLLFCFLNLLCFRHFHCYSSIVSQGPLLHQSKRGKLFTGLKIATDTVANATNIFSLATKISGLVAKVATRFQKIKIKTKISSYLALLSS